MTPQERAAQLRATGVSETRGIRTLMREFPILERCEALAAWGHIPEIGWWSSATKMFNRPPFTKQGMDEEEWQRIANPNPFGIKTDRDYDRQSRRGA